MNKQRFIDYLRSPERLTEGQFTELQKLLVDYPYFSIAKSIAARAAKDLENPSKGKLIASAAIYATDRKHLKKYINGELVFLTDKPIVTSDVEISLSVTTEPNPLISGDVRNEPSTTEKIAPHVPSDAVHVPDDVEVDQIIDELQRDMDELKRSRMHFVEIQNQLDTNATFVQRRAEEPAEIPSPTKSEVEPTIEETQPSKVIETPPAVAFEKPVKSKPPKEAPIKFDLDALKRELAREVDDKEQVQANPKQQPSKIEEKSLPTDTAKEKEKLTKPLRSRKVEEDDDDEDMKEPPPVVNVPGSITNMSPAEENDDDDDVELSLPRRKSPRKPRTAVKIKREDLDKIIGKKVSDSPAKAEKSAEKTQEKPKLEKVKASLQAEDKVEKPTKEQPKAEVLVDSESAVAEVPAEKPKTNPEAIAESVKIEKSAPLAPKELDPIVPVEPKVVVSEEPTTPRDEEPARNSIKAFLDLGMSVERTSVSRASSSRSKRSARANRARPSDEGTGDGKGDDESGGQGSLIDKFIQENPSIQRRAVENKDDLSADSGKWNPELASEYLAKIYLDQGNTKRAILIYETLSLKFPEKKSYFAGLIEKLKK